MAHDEIGDDRSDREGDTNGLIRLITHSLVGSFRAFDRFVADTARDFLGAIQRGGQTLASFPTFSPATSAVAVIKARASSASVARSLAIACVCLLIFLVLSVCSWGLQLRQPICSRRWSRILDGLFDRFRVSPVRF